MDPSDRAVRSPIAFESQPRVGGGPVSAADFQSLLAERLKELAGVDAVGGASAIPCGRWATPGRVRMGGADGEGALVRVRLQNRIGDYFDAMGIDLVAGRPFDDADAAGGEPVAIVSAALRDRLRDAGEDADYVVMVPFGREPMETRLRIVGVTGDVVHYRIGETPPLVLYVPHAQLPGSVMQFVVRSSAPAPELARRIRAEAARIDPAQPLQGFESLESLILETMHTERALARILGVLAVIALSLAAAGVYGSVAFATRSRLPEMGLRKVLGASGGSLLGLTMTQAMGPVAAGTVAGVGVLVILQRMAGGLLAQVPTPDGWSYGLSVLVFGVAALVGCGVPAREAIRVEPTRVLGAEP